MTSRPRSARATVPQRDEEPPPQLESPPPYDIVYPDSNTQVKPKYSGLQHGQGKSYASIMIKQEAAHAQFWQAINNMSPQERRAAIVEAARREGLVTLAAPEPASVAEVPYTATEPRPVWDTRAGDDLHLTPEQFVAKYYAAEKAAVTPRPQWDKEGKFGNRPADFIAIAFRPEMLAKTLHRGVVAAEQKDLAVKLASWLRSHEMPKGVDIPTQPEWNTRQLEAHKLDGKATPHGGSSTSPSDEMRHYRLSISALAKAPQA